jgi:succinyl-diaminopimelate desuccinylase
MSNPWLIPLLEHHSPTGYEAPLVDWLISQKNVLKPDWVGRVENNLWFRWYGKTGYPRIALVGHTDVVPAPFPVRREGTRIHGAGASDMKAALAVFLQLAEHHRPPELALDLIFYAKEEGTPVKDNGLYTLISQKPEWFKGIDLAIVGEPTDNAIQLGCLGSIHAQVHIKGQACHSARPWNGENALYKALPFLNHLSKVPYEEHTLFGVTFVDVIQVTESQSEPGRTSIPGYWKANVNYRYSPTYSETDAESKLTEIMQKSGLASDEWKIIDHSFAGAVIDSPVFRQFLSFVPHPKQAKQAWTDVAQLTRLLIPAFNWGPGLTNQAHTSDEYCDIHLISQYEADLIRALKNFSLEYS